MLRGLESSSLTLVAAPLGSPEIIVIARASGANLRNMIKEEIIETDEKM
jgi:hypothetical protein